MCELPLDDEAMMALLVRLNSIQNKIENLQPVPQHDVQWMAHVMGRLAKDRIVRRNEVVKLQGRVRELEQGQTVMLLDSRPSLLEARERRVA